MNDYTKIIDLKCPVLSNQQLSPGLFKIRLEAPEIASQARAGQFVQVRVAEGWNPLMRRPFSLYDTSEEGWIDLLYKVYGEGTLLLSKVQKGQRLSLLGPLGKRWKTPESPPLLLGGGIGVVPLYFLAKELEREKRPFRIALGIRNSSELPLVEDFKSLEAPLEVYTEDGSLGKKGYVSEAIKEDSGPVYACGPTPMLRAVVKIGEAKKLSGQISLEERMPCGFGICFGCVVYSPSQETYLRSCTEGPIFDLGEVEL